MTKEWTTLIKNGQFGELREKLIAMNAADVAHVFEEVNRMDLLLMFRLLPKEFASMVFSHMDYSLQRIIIEAITDKEVAGLVDTLFMDDTVDFIEEMPANIVKKVLRNATAGKRELINHFLNYPDDSAGSIMTIEYVSLKKGMTVSDALTRIKETGIDKETIDTCYVTDNYRILEGEVTLRRLILEDGQSLIADIMERNIKSVGTLENQEEIAYKFQKYDYFVMPVVDTENRLVGIVTVDDILDVIIQEGTEDLQKMAAMQPSEKEYLKSNPLELAKQRIPWLLVLMISATFTGNIIKKYDNALQSVMVLASFIPMLMDTGGNSGSQSSTLVIRGLSLGDIKESDAFKVFVKEMQVSLIVGLTLAFVNFLRIYYLEKIDFLVSLIVCLTLFFTVVLAKVVGGLLPIIAKKVHLDPAIMAGPLITTVVDAVALLIYFSVATSLLGI